MLNETEECLSFQNVSFVSHRISSILTYLPVTLWNGIACTGSKNVSRDFHVAQDIKTVLEPLEITWKISNLFFCYTWAGNKIV